MFRGAQRNPSSLDAVRTAMKAVLNTFVSERLQRYPDGRQTFETARAHLTIGHFACEQVLVQMVNNNAKTDMFRPILDGIASAPFRHLQLFFCVQQLQLVNLLWTENADLSQGWPALMAEGACDMYSQSCQIVADILSCVAERPDAQQQERFINCAGRLQASMLGIKEPTVFADRAIIELVIRMNTGYAGIANGDQVELIQIANSLLK